MNDELHRAAEDLADAEACLEDLFDHHLRLLHQALRRFRKAQERELSARATHGALGEPSRITAATVQDGLDKEAARAARRRKGDSQ
jgi:hypothetical protein